MNLLLIAPAAGPWRGVGKRRLVSGRTFRFSLLSLLSVAAETPPDVNIRILDEQIDDIPWNESPDLVGITCMTALAPRAYEISDRFRRRGVPVVLGGMHPTFCPDEALQHADAVVCGEAEGIWPQVVEDARCGRMAGVYRVSSPCDLSRLQPPPRHLLRQREYAAFPVQATRGCPHVCAFCSVTAFHHNAQRRRPVAAVLEEIRQLPSRFFIFVDDHLTADLDYACELFYGLIPLRKRWVTQATLSITREPILLETMARAGCIGLFSGMETLCQTNLSSVNKNCHRIEEYQEAIRLCHQFGIGVEAGIVLGFDEDGPDVFEATLSVLDDLQVDAIQASIFTPLPGTPQFETMRDRILDTNWGHYDFHHVVFQPRRLSAESLQAGHDWMTREFYSPARISKRLARWTVQKRGLSTLPYAAAINLAYFGRIRTWHIKGWNPNNEALNYIASTINEIPAV